MSSDYYLFRVSVSLPNMVHLGSTTLGWQACCYAWDPAQLPAVGRSDLFGTHLWRTFSILVLREIKRSQDPILTSVLTKIRMDMCDQEVTGVLRSIVQPRDMDKIQLDRTVVICSRGGSRGGGALGAQAPPLQPRQHTGFYRHS